MMKPGHFLLLAAGWWLPIAGSATPREVIVYSGLTDAGRKLTPPTRDRPARCRVGSGGYHEWGGIRAGETPAKLEFVDPLVRAALRVNGFEGLHVGETADVVVVFQWGCMRPNPVGLGIARSERVANQAELLDLVGGGVLSDGRNGHMRSALIEASLEERYFLIVSAFEPSSYARNTKTLLWRTQCSVPLAGISQAQAFPVLAGAGAVYFGRDTPLPVFIAVDVVKLLQAAVDSAVR